MKHFLVRNLISNDAQGKLAGELSKDDVHHLRNVLRVTAPGHEIVICDEVTGLRKRALITENLPSMVRFRIIGDLSATNDSQQERPRYTLVMALLKGDHNDLVCEKCTELGVANLIFYQADRSIVRLSEKNLEQKLARWQRIAKQAAQQCGRTNSPTITVTPNLNSALSTLLKTDKATPLISIICCSLEDSAKLMRELPPPTEEVALVIGPEGDFTDKEIELCKKHQAAFASLGNLTLRAETAAICCLASAKAIWN